MNTNERSLRNESCSACRTLRKKVLALVTLVETSHSTKISGRRGRWGRYLRSIGTPPVCSDARIVRRTSTWAWRLRPRELVALGGQAALELGDDPVHGGEVLDRPGGQRAVELVQRPLGRQARGALDQVALELAAQVLLEPPQLVAGDAVAARVVLGQVGLRLGSQAERAADPLHVDAEHARALAAAEGGDRQPGQVAQRGVVAVAQRGGDLLAQRVEVDLAVAPGRRRVGRLR